MANTTPYYGGSESNSLMVIHGISDVIKGDKTSDEALLDILKQKGIPTDEDELVDLGKQKLASCLNLKTIPTNEDELLELGKEKATQYLQKKGIPTNEDELLDLGLKKVTNLLTKGDSSFAKALKKSKIPGKVISSVQKIGYVLKQLDDGELTVESCLSALGECGGSYLGSVVGQALIPIPVVGSMIGSLVGSVLSARLVEKLTADMNAAELEHEERMRVIEECKAAAEAARAYRLELEQYLEAYFKDYQDCFDAAFADIETAFREGNVDGVIAGSNQITRKLGGTVEFENMDEFEQFLCDDKVAVL